MESGLEPSLLCSSHPALRTSHIPHIPLIISGMNFLITGAAGFLGSSLANLLAREGHQVRGLDDLSTGDPKTLSPDVHFTRGDVMDRPRLWTLPQGGRPRPPPCGARLGA